MVCSKCGQDIDAGINTLCVKCWSLAQWPIQVHRTVDPNLPFMDTEYIEGIQPVTKPEIEKLRTDINDVGESLAEFALASAKAWEGLAKSLNAINGSLDNITKILEVLCEAQGWMSPEKKEDKS